MPLELTTKQVREIVGVPEKTLEAWIRPSAPKKAAPLALPRNKTLDGEWTRKTFNLRDLLRIAAWAELYRLKLRPAQCPSLVDAVEVELLGFLKNIERRDIGRLDEVDGPGDRQGLFAVMTVIDPDEMEFQAGVSVRPLDDARPLVKVAGSEGEVEILNNAQMVTRLKSGEAISMTVVNVSKMARRLAIVLLENYIREEKP